MTNDSRISITAVAVPKSYRKLAGIEQCSHLLILSLADLKREKVTCPIPMRVTLLRKVIATFTATFESDHNALIVQLCNYITRCSINFPNVFGACRRKYSKDNRQITGLSRQLKKNKMSNVLSDEGPLFSTIYPITSCT